MSYSPNQVEAALRLYDSLGSVTGTIQKLGYPSLGTMMKWLATRKAHGGKFPLSHLRKVPR